MFPYLQMDNMINDQYHGNSINVSPLWHLLKILFLVPFNLHLIVLAWIIENSNEREKTEKKIAKYLKCF